VTVGQFRAFVEASAYQPGDPDSLRGVDNHPVVGVTWHDGIAYCEWLTAQLLGDSRTPPELRELLQSGGRVALPSEAEWEKAARGTHGRIYPWGNAFDPNLANTDEGGIGATSAVGCFPGGASPYGMLDMSGNVWEWTRSQYKEYPYQPLDGREDLQGGDRIDRVLRGGSWGGNVRGARCAVRLRLSPNFGFYGIGFRVGVLPSSTLNSGSSGTLSL
jgi:formylglycine-generating enzyme required for sulfatase activity